MNYKSGSALVSALFIMTLVAIAATAMSTRLRLDIYRTQSTLNSDALYLASEAVTGWAMDELSLKTAVFKALDSTGKIRIFPKKLRTMYPGVVIQGALFDLQAKINLNSLSDKTFPALFYRLLETQSKTIPMDVRKLIFNATIRWISPQKNNDASLNYYLKQTPPYYPAYQPMRSVSEFRMVQGVTPAIYQTLFPYITALPTVTSINLNTACQTVLMCLGNGLNKTQLEELLTAREQEGGLTIANINPWLKKLNIPAQQVTIESNYFLSEAITSTRDHQLTVYTLIHRKKNRQGEFVFTLVSKRLNAI